MSPPEGGGLVQDGPLLERVWKGYSRCRSHQQAGRGVQAWSQENRWAGSGPGGSRRPCSPPCSRRPAPRAVQGGGHADRPFCSVPLSFPDWHVGGVNPHGPRPAAPWRPFHARRGGATRPQTRSRAPRKLPGGLGVVFSTLSPARPGWGVPFLCRLGARPSPPPLPPGEAHGCPGGLCLCWWPACGWG